jgi:hypothetical protein
LQALRGARASESESEVRQQRAASHENADADVSYVLNDVVSGSSIRQLLREPVDDRGELVTTVITTFVQTAQSRKSSHCLRGHCV